MFVLSSHVPCYMLGIVGNAIRIINYECSIRVSILMLCIVELKSKWRCYVAT